MTHLKLQKLQKGDNTYRLSVNVLFSNISFLWAPAQRKPATMLYFANVCFIYFYGRHILRPW